MWVVGLFWAGCKTGRGVIETLCIVESYWEGLPERVKVPYMKCMRLRGNRT